MSDPDLTTLTNVELIKVWRDANQRFDAALSKNAPRYKALTTLIAVRDEGYRRDMDLYCVPVIPRPAAEVGSEIDSLLVENLSKIDNRQNRLWCALLRQMVNALTAELELVEEAEA